MTDEEHTEAAEGEAPAPPATRSTGTRTGGVVDGEGRAALEGRPSEELPYVDDPVTRWWVVLIVAVFAAIFAYALLLGRGGFLSDLLPGAASTPVTIESPSPFPADATDVPGTPTTGNATPLPASGASPTMPPPRPTPTNESPAATSQPVEPAGPAASPAS